MIKKHFHIISLPYFQINNPPDFELNSECKWYQFNEGDLSILTGEICFALFKDVPASTRKFRNLCSELYRKI